MKTIKFILILLVSVTKLLSQNSSIDSLKILYAKEDSRKEYKIIPYEVFNGEFDVLAMGFEFDTVKVIKKTEIEISWHSNYIDGEYALNITPEQIYLRSYHENPNPDCLYWLKPISKDQFTTIRNYLKRKKDKQFRNITTDYSHKQSFLYKDYIKETFSNNNCADNRYVNFRRLLEKINTILGQTNTKIEIPDIKNFNSINPVRLKVWLDEI